MDWKQGLQNFLDSNPDLPEGEELQAPEPERKPKDKLRVIVERKGHRGKTVTIIEGFTCADDELQEIASRLKRFLGTGGSARAGEILVQGDRRADVEAWLKSNNV